MKKTIAVVNANPDERGELCRLLERSHYRADPIEALSELTRRLAEVRCDALILDLDTPAVDNRFIRTLTRENPDLCIIGTSSRHFHPELEEAMRAHISACLSKPVSEEELVYWLKSLCGTEPHPRASPRVA